MRQQHFCIALKELDQQSPESEVVDFGVRVEEVEVDVDQALLNSQK